MKYLKPYHKYLVQVIVGRVCGIFIGLLYFLNDKEKYQSKARLLALLGFLPAIALLVFLIT